MITTVSDGFVKIAEHFECKGKPENYLNAYKDSGGVWTIGIGIIQYPNGQRVKEGDVITMQQLRDYFKWESNGKAAKVNAMTRDDISQQIFDALVDICFNIGTNALQRSTLLKVLNLDLTDIKIVDRFIDWRYDNGKFVPGLLRRRMADSYHYFTGDFKFDWINYKLNLPVVAANEVKAAIKAFNKNV